MSSRVDSYSKEEAATLTLSRKEGAADRETKEQTFNQYRPMVPQDKVWRVKAVDQPARPVKPPQATGLTGAADRSDRPEQPVRPVDPSIQQKAESAIPVSVPCNGETPLSFSVR